MHLMRFKDLPPQIININPVSVQGQFKAVLRDLMGRPVYDSGWFNNLIVNQGMNMIPYPFYYGPGNFWEGAQLGLGSSTPSVTQTALDVRIGGQAEMVYPSIQDGNDLYHANDPVGHYGMSSMAKYRWNAGIVTENNITEIGIFARQSAITYAMFTRQLFPVPINKGIDNILDVYYRLYAYNSVADVTGTTAAIEGVTYDYLIRPRYFDYTGNPSSFPGTPFSQGGENELYNADGYGSNYVLGANFTTNSTGTTSSGPNIGIWNSWDGYVENDWWVDMNTSMSVDTLFLDNEIRGIEFAMYPGNVEFRCRFSSTVDGKGVFKDNERTAQFQFRQQFARRTMP